MIRVHTLALLGTLLAAFALADEPTQPAPPPPPPEESKPPSETKPTEEKPAETKPKRPGTMDKMELDATAIIGNRELPKVLYIVPWKKSDLGDLTGMPTHSLLDEVLAPVDREVFRRQTEYFDKLNQKPQ